jgi:hypothetical protein
MLRPALKTPTMLGSGVCRSSNAPYYLYDYPMCQMVSGGGETVWAGGQGGAQNAEFPARDRSGRPLSCGCAA